MSALHLFAAGLTVLLLSAVTWIVIDTLATGATAIIDALLNR